MVAVRPEISSMMVDGGESCRAPLLVGSGAPGKGNGWPQWMAGLIEERGVVNEG